MIDDLIVSEVRRHRAVILESYGGDLHRYHDAVQQSQRNRFGGQLVTLQPRKRAEPDGAASGSQPIRSETNSATASAGPLLRRSG